MADDDDDGSPDETLEEYVARMNAEEGVPSADHYESRHQNWQHLEDYDPNLGSN